MDKKSEILEAMEINDKKNLVSKICPVTFNKNNEPIRDQTLNYNHLLGFEMASVFDIPRFNDLNNIKNKILSNGDENKSPYESTFTNIDYTIERRNYKVFDGYIINNITDLFIHNIMTIYRDITRDFKDDIKLEFYNHFINQVPDLDVIHNIITSTLHEIYKSNSKNKFDYTIMDELYFNYITIAFDVLFSKYVSLIVEPIIINTYFRMPLQGQINMYKSYCLSFYAPDAKYEDIPIPEPQVMYSAVITCVRESINLTLVNLRHAMNSVAMSAASLLTTSTDQEYFIKDHSDGTYYNRSNKIGLDDKTTSYSSASSVMDGVIGRTYNECDK